MNVEVNPDNESLRQLREYWQKITAMLVWKLAPDGVTITAADMVAFQQDGRFLLAHGHHDSFEFRMVTREEGDRLAAEYAASQSENADG